MRIFSYIFGTLSLLAVLGFVVVALVVADFSQDLPDYLALAHYAPPVTTRVYAGDGSLVAEYATENRNFVPIDSIPKLVKNSFLAAEDKNFYTHPGVDPMGILRAAVTDLRNRGRGDDRRPAGASTITQQVAKNFFLTNEVSVGRKIKEAILAFRLESAFSKDHILELYLNEIYLGQGNYGVAAAANSYFGKSLDELTVAEAAFLGGLPKAPNTYNPQRNPAASKDRRDYVINRLVDDGFISDADGKEALSEPLVTRARPTTAAAVPGGEYFAGDIRREIAARYGEDSLYKGGLTVRSTLDPALQSIARTALRNGLVAYDRRHGWRGPMAHLDSVSDWLRQLQAQPAAPGLDPWQRAVVLSVSPGFAEIGLADGSRGHIPMSELRWARADLPEQKVGPVPGKPADVLHQGDVVAVEPVTSSEDGKEHYPAATFALRQIPKVQGALVAMDPHTGRVLAMQGGYSYDMSQFNRASQAQRQPGSSFKPFVYMPALDSGYTPSSLILDGPIEIAQGPGLPIWKPGNFEKNFLGPITMRVAIEDSRNLATIRMAAAIGMEKVATYAERFGVVDHLPRILSMSIGAGDTTVLQMTAAYSEIVNGGRKITPTLIDRIQDRNGQTIYRHDDRVCAPCRTAYYADQPIPDVPDSGAQIIDPITAYQMVHILEGVVERGTGSAVKEVGKPLAGKTGTSNDSRDNWFMGFAPDLTVGVFVGFDEPATLGSHETGGTSAAPIFRDFMEAALKDKPATPFRVPPGVSFVRVDASSGQPPSPGDKKVILEAFRPGTEPDGNPGPVLDAAPTSLAGQNMSGTSAADDEDDQGEDEQAASPDGAPTDGTSTDGTPVASIPGDSSADPATASTATASAVPPAPVGVNATVPNAQPVPQAGGLY